MEKPTFGANLGVGFYFLLLLLFMYVKSARMNIPNIIMIVSTSFTSMASPPFEGKPCSPKIQLYLYSTNYPNAAQVFLSIIRFTRYFRHFYVYYDLIASLSYNVYAFTNPHWLKLLTDPAQRSVRRVEDLASAGLSAETTPPNILLADRGRIARCVNAVLSAVKAFLEIHFTMFSSVILFVWARFFLFHLVFIYLFN